MTLDPNLDFEPELPSKLHRGPGITRTLAGWLVGLVVLVVVGGIGFFVVRQIGDQPMPGPRANPDKNSPPVESTLPIGGNTDLNTTGTTPSDSTATPDSVTIESPTVPVGGNARNKVQASNPTSKPKYKEVLNGELSRDQSLSAAKSPYQIQGTVVVQRGVVLTVEGGVEIVAAPYSELIVHGILLTSGTIDSPVWVHAEQANPGAWKGIRFDGDFCEGRLRGMVVSDAEAGVTIAGSPEVDKTKFMLEDCLLQQNRTGLKLDNFTSLRVTNTAIVNNRDDGVWAREDDGVYVRATLASNGGKGYVCMGKPGPQFDSCSIVGNEKGGVHCATAGEVFRAKWTASKCNLLANGPYDVFTEHQSGVILSGNFWGAATTRELQVLGDNPKKKPRGRIWDGLNPKYRGQGVVIASNFASDFISAAGAEPAVLAMGGSNPVDVASWVHSARKRPPSTREVPNAPDVPPLFVDIAAQLRELLASRRYEEAATLLGESSADPDLKDVWEFISGAQEDVRLVQDLWQLAAQKMDSLKPGDPMSVAGIRGVLVSYQDGQITIRAETVSRMSKFCELRPTDVIFLVAGPKGPTEPDLLKMIWLFLWVDKQGIDADVDHWSELAARASVDLQGRGMYLIPKGKASVPTEEK